MWAQGGEGSLASVHSYFYVIWSIWMKKDRVATSRCCYFQWSLVRIDAIAKSGFILGSSGKVLIDDDYFWGRCLLLLCLHGRVNSLCKVCIGLSVLDELQPGFDLCFLEQLENQFILFHLMVGFCLISLYLRPFILALHSFLSVLLFHLRPDLNVAFLMSFKLLSPDSAFLVLSLDQLKQLLGSLVIRNLKLQLVSILKLLK